jgi:hypothetical protein
LAIKPRDNETFYREVDEELRKEQLTGFWKRYGALLIGGILLFLAALAGFLWWQQRQTEQAGERGQALIETYEQVQAGQAKAAVPKLDQLATEGPEGIRAAALLTKADIAIQQKNLPAAAAAFRSVADNAEFAEPYRQLALVRQTALSSNESPQEGDPPIGPLAVAGNPWFGSAGELVALAHLKTTSPRGRPIFAAMARMRSFRRASLARAADGGRAGHRRSDRSGRRPGLAPPRPKEQAE